MDKDLIIRGLILICLLLLLGEGLFATKYAGEIFDMGAGVRNFALGGCGVSDPNGIALAYWNAALLNKIDENKFELMHAEEYMGLLKYDTFSAILGKKLNLGFVLTRIGINDIPLTKLEDPDQPVSNDNRPYKYKTITNSDLVAYFGLSRKVGEYNLGFTTKLAYRSLAEESGYGFGADVSAYYDISENWLIAARLRDFFTTQIFWANGTHEIVNPGLDLETNYLYKIRGLSLPLKFYLRTSFYSEGREEAATLALGFLSFDPHLGIEIGIHPQFQIFAGFDIENLTTGFSLNIKNWLINYSFEHIPELESSHRISIGFIL